jgi:hypothetical protein
MFILCDERCAIFCVKPLLFFSLLYLNGLSIYCFFLPQFYQKLHKQKTFVINAFIFTALKCNAVGQRPDGGAYGLLLFRRCIYHPPPLSKPQPGLQPTSSISPLLKTFPPCLQSGVQTCELCNILYKSCNSFYYFRLHFCV